ncbi:MAG: insulinase family protein [Acidobacteria bacterium]|nr:insulinase family protein [Acidobacteriota bacterium]
MSVDRRLLPIPAPPPGITFPPLTYSELTPGVRLATVERRELPLVSMLWLWHAGTSADRDDAAGLAALTADLLDEGTAALTMAELHDELAGIGGQLDTDIGHDATVISMLALSKHRERAVELFVDMAERPRLAAADVARVQGLRLNRLRQLRHSASALADLLFMRKLYGTHPYGRPGIGTEASLAAFTPDQVRAYHDRLATTPATVVVIGDIGHEEAVRLVSRHVSDRPRVSQPDPAVPLPASGTRLAFVPREGAAQSEIRIGRVALPRKTAEYHAAVVTNMLLGGAFVSRINMRLREEKGVTYGARSSFQFLRLAGPFSVQASIQSEATAASVRDVLDELDALGGSRPVTDEELASARDALTRGYARGFETAEQIARAAAQLALYDLPADTFDRFSESVSAVTTADVTALARRWLESGQMRAVVVGEPTTARAGLDAVGLDQPESLSSDEVLAGV